MQEWLQGNNCPGQFSENLQELRSKGGFDERLDQQRTENTKTFKNRIFALGGFYKKDNQGGSTALCLLCPKDKYTFETCVVKNMNPLQIRETQIR